MDVGVGCLAHKDLAKRKVDGVFSFGISTQLLILHSAEYIILYTDQRKHTTRVVYPHEHTFALTCPVADKVNRVIPGTSAVLEGDSVFTLGPVVSVSFTGATGARHLQALTCAHCLPEYASAVYEVNPVSYLIVESSFLCRHNADELNMSMYANPSHDARVGTKHKIEACKHTACTKCQRMEPHWSPRPVGFPGITQQQISGHATWVSPGYFAEDARIDVGGFAYVFDRSKLGILDTPELSIFRLDRKNPTGRPIYPAPIDMKVHVNKFLGAWSYEETTSFSSPDWVIQPALMERG